jgi:hypothetical protein
MTENEMPMRDARDDTRWKAYIVAGAAVEFGMFTLIWVISGSVQAAAMVCFLLTYSVVLVGATALFMRSMHRHDVEHIVAAVQQHQPAIDTEWTVRTPQLPAPGSQWVSEDNAMYRREAVAIAAMKIWNTMHEQYNIQPDMRPRPTRENIKAMVPGLNSNGLITKAMDHLKEMGLVTGGGQGREYEWT